MNWPDRYLLVRAAAVYVTLMATVAVCLWRRPTPRTMTAALLASLWNVPVLLLLHVCATRAGWWQFDARGGLLLGMPVDLLLSWAWLWGGLPALALTAVPLPLVGVVALAVDVALMPAASPVLQLAPAWLLGETLALLTGLVPGQLLARWTIRGEHLGERAALQALAFSGLLLLVLPAIAIEGSGGKWLNPLTRPAWQVGLLVQVLAVPALLGLTAVQEFVTRGRGTPVPFDPPERLVTTGVYAYLRNPMQLSAVMLLGLLGPVLGNLWISAAGVMAHLYSAGLAGWDEDEDLRRRYGSEWMTYRQSVHRWIPRLYPWPGQPVARLFVGEKCEKCRSVATWLTRHAPRQLIIVAAESHPTGMLFRITYEPVDGTPPATGVAAVARALEHIHLGWALVGWTLRMPGIRALAQLLVDASGGEPQPLGTCHVLGNGAENQPSVDGPRPKRHPVHARTRM